MSAMSSRQKGCRISIHQRMRKPHFGAVDGAIASAFEDGEDVVVFRVEDDALGRGLRRVVRMGLILQSLG